MLLKDNTLNQSTSRTIMDMMSQLTLQQETTQQINQTQNDSQIFQQKLDLNGTEIYFPFQPYCSQIDYMNVLLDALDKKQHAILQSPSGSGKTLSNLCSTLGWLEKQKKQQRDNKEPIKIIYACRTHNQITQVIQELKKSFYRPKNAIQSSQNMLCINNQYKYYNEQAKRQACMEQKIFSSQPNINEGNKNKCHLYYNYQINQQHFQQIEILDLEEIQQFGQKNQICPYYFERNRTKEADIIFMTHINLLTNWKKPNFIQRNLKNKIIIMDSAYDILNTAESCYNFTINNNQIKLALLELLDNINFLTSKQLLDEFSQSFSSSQTQFYTQEENKQLNMTQILIEISCTMSNFYESMPYFEPNKFDENDHQNGGKYYNGMMVYKLLNKNTSSQHMNGYFQNGISRDNIKFYSDILEQFISFMNNHKPEQNLQIWAQFIQYIKFILESSNQFDQEKFPVRLLVKKNIEDIQIEFIMICLDSQFAFKKLLEQNIRQIILTCNSLDPLETWDQALGFTIPIKQSFYINDETKQQVLAGSINLRFLKSNKVNLVAIRYLGDLFNQITQYIPNGVLVFFSSKNLMDQCKIKWEQSGVLDSIGQSKATYWDDGFFGNAKKLIQNFSKSSKIKRKGAILFSFQRGSISDSIDLSEEIIKAIFIVGLPLRKFSSDSVIQKKFILEQNGLNFDQWYNLQAISSTNQSIGRIIRSQQNFGKSAIYLIDDRFNKFKQHLTTFVAPFLKQWITLEEILQDTKQHFSDSKLNLHSSFETTQDEDTINDSQFLRTYKKIQINYQEQQLTESLKQLEIKSKSKDPSLASRFSELLNQLNKTQLF